MEQGTITEAVVYDHALSPQEIIMVELVQAAIPFLSGDTVDETCGTIPLMDRLEEAIKQANISLGVQE